MDEAGELPKRTPHQKLVNTKIAEKVTKITRRWPQCLFCKFRMSHILTFH